MTSKAMVERWVAWEDLTEQEKYEHRGGMASTYEHYKYKSIEFGPKALRKDAIITHVLFISSCPSRL